MDIKRIIKEEINDFDWAENLIKVGNCFAIRDRRGGEMSLKITKIMIHPAKSYRNEDPNIKDNFKHDDVIVVFSGSKSSLDWLSYTEVESWLNRGVLIPIDCEQPNDKEFSIIDENDEMEWIKENPIEVGKCFLVKSSIIFGWNERNDFTVKIIDIEQDEGKWVDIPKGSFNEDTIKIKFNNYLELYYSDFQEWLNNGWLIPTDCGNSINESDDLQWIKDIKPSFYTLVIDLGEKISRAKYRKVMLKLDSMGYKWYQLAMNVRDKLLVNRFGPKPIIHFYPGFRYLILGPTGEIPEKEISHTNLIRKYPSLDVIPVNDFLSQPINESNDLQWIKDVETSKFRPEVGDYIEVRNKGSEEAYRNWLGSDLSEAYDDGIYGYNIQGEVIPEIQKAMRGKGFNIIEHNTDDVIFFPYHEYMLEYADIHVEFKDLDLEYYPISYSSKDINESEEMDDFGWIKDSQPISYDFLLGKSLYFNPSISDAETNESIMKLLESIGFKRWDRNPNTNEIDDWGGLFKEEEIIGLYFRPSDGQVMFTTDDDLDPHHGSDFDEYDYEEHLHGAVEDISWIEILDGWQVLGHYLGTV